MVSVNCFLIMGKMDEMNKIDSFDHLA